MSEEKKSILLVDDSVTIRNFVKSILEEANYKVIEASDGEEGISIYKKNADSIDLIITDIYMPKKSGLELILELEKEYEGIKIIILSDGGKDNFTNDSKVCEALGAAFFIKKDLIKDKLVDLVKKVI